MKMKHTQHMFNHNIANSSTFCKIDKTTEVMKVLYVLHLNVRSGNGVPSITEVYIDTKLALLIPGNYKMGWHTNS
jgi:hypothetical protein